MKPAEQPLEPDISCMVRSALRDAKKAGRSLGLLRAFSSVESIIKALVPRCRPQCRSFFMAVFCTRHLGYRCSGWPKLLPAFRKISSLH